MDDKYTKTESEQRKISFRWMNAIKETLVKCGFSGIWETQNFQNHKFEHQILNRPIYK